MILQNELEMQNLSDPAQPVGQIHHHDRIGAFRIFGGRLSLGITGVVHGIGVTFTALCFNSILHLRIQNSICGSLWKWNLTRLEAVMDRNNRLTHVDESSFVADDITYFKDGKIACTKSIRGFGRVLSDFGCLCDEKAITEFNRSDIRLVVCPSADWKQDIIKDFMARMNPYDPTGMVMFSPLWESR